MKRNHDGFTSHKTSMKSASIPSKLTIDHKNFGRKPSERVLYSHIFFLKIYLTKTNEIPLFNDPF